MFSSRNNSEKENIPSCKYCQKSFANFSNLRHHIQIIHFKENKWDCRKCGKICSSKSNLKVHFRTHIRVKPYTCKHCQYDCMHHSSIKDHLNKNHPNKPHTTFEPGYIYNSQAVPEPDEFNSIDFNQISQRLNPIFRPFILNTIQPIILPRKSFTIDDILNLSIEKRKRFYTDKEKPE